jgi:metal-responsive CopG/Arc/MetJ family transcriptional regulator
MRKTISLSLPEPLDAELREHAEKYSISLSKLIQRLLTEYLKQQSGVGK